MLARHQIVAWVVAVAGGLIALSLLFPYWYDEGRYEGRQRNWLWYPPWRDAQIDWAAQAIELAALSVLTGSAIVAVSLLFPKQPRTG